MFAMFGELSVMLDPSHPVGVKGLAWRHDSHNVLTRRERFYMVVILYRVAIILIGRILTEKIKPWLIRSEALECRRYFPLMLGGSRNRSVEYGYLDSHQAYLEMLVYFCCLLSIEIINGISEDRKCFNMIFISKYCKA